MRHAFATIAFVFFVAAGLTAAQAGQLSKLGGFDSGAVHVDFDNYNDDGKIVALIGMKSDGTTISFAFDKAEWPKLLTLWRSARAMTGSSYATAGSLTEVGSSARCVITLAGGPGVRMTVVDPTAAAFAIVVQPSDADGFENSLRQIGEAATIVN
jgi:hypothetical protein